MYIGLFQKITKQGGLRTYSFEKPLEFLGFYFILGNSTQNKATALETPQNCVTYLRNFKA